MSVETLSPIAIQMPEIVPSTPEDIFDSQVTREVGRQVQLSGLPAEGFHPSEHVRLTEQIAAIGFSVDNFRNFVRSPNTDDQQDTLASWGVGRTNYGEFTVHNLFYEIPPEGQLATLAHESAHANTALDPKNAEIFGGEAERLEAKKYVESLAQQSLQTGKWLDGYHKYLADELADGKITHDIFVEETQAIASELALTNRNHLVQVQEAQHKAIEDQARIARLNGEDEPKKVDLLTTEEGEAKGIDRALIKLLDGVSDYDSLTAHVDMLKARFYPEDSAAIARERKVFELQPIHVSPINVGVSGIIIADIRHQLAERDEEERRKSLY